jgi:EAL domain-containing protein (putative c-di-GMP-specific phosphodiesterase class I)
MTTELHTTSASDITPASTDELIRSAVDLARACLGMDVGFVTEFKEGVRIFRHVASIEGFSPIQVGDCDPLGESYCQQIVDGAIPAAIQDSHQHPTVASLHATSALGIRAHLGVPIRFSNGDVFGTFCCYSRDPQANLSNFNVGAMSHFAWLIGQLLEARVLGERERARLVERMQAVIRQCGFTIVYQPVTDLARNAVIGYEALARFSAEPQRGPDQWFSEAHTIELGHWLEVLAIEKALEGLARIGAGQYLALNVSPQTILTGALDKALQGVALERLVLEVTEHSCIADYGSLAEALSQLRKAGLRLAVDDAGSGYASFRHILKLRPDIIKLDQSLIRGIDHDPGSRALAAALITFARETGSGVIAEGVETEEELAALRTLGVTTAQGYLLGRPGELPGA